MAWASSFEVFVRGFDSGGVNCEGLGFKMCLVVLVLGCRCQV